jgi:ubiquinone/menaquinone biosynthesis C-methylase UbiE
MPYRQTLAAAYDAGVKEEYNRLLASPLQEAEYQLIAELLEEYIPGGSVAIDIGSGPGRYAEYLLQRNCKVGVVDLSAKSLKAFSDRMENSCFQENILFNRVSCATQLSWIKDNYADAILLMGPLYHLIDDAHRNIALSHCRRILKPGGFLFSLFLSPFSVLNPLPADPSESPSVISDNALVDKSTITHTLFQGYHVPQYRCWPCKAGEIMKSNHFQVIRIRNIEGTGSFIPEEKIKEFDTPEKKADLLNHLRTTAEVETRLGITHQYIVVGKPE